MHFLASFLEINQSFVEIIAIEIRNSSVEVEILSIKYILLIDILGAS